MGQWLRLAGVLGGKSDWEIDDDTVEALTGVRTATIDEWSGLSGVQKALLRTLRRLADMNGVVPMAAAWLVDQAVIEHGRIFPGGDLRAKVYNPLRAGGWLDLMVPGQGSRGKGGLITATDKLMATDLTKLTGYPSGSIPNDLRDKLDRPLSQIYTELRSDDTYVKGIALELLALKLSTELGLLPVRFRLRGSQTGGAEVDLLAEGAHLHFSRWLFQCKNTSTSNVEDLAREVGMATLLRAHVIVMVTTGRFTRPVVDLAKELAVNGPLQVVLVDDDVLRRYRQSGRSGVAGYFHDQALEVLRVKRPQVDRAIDETAS